MATKDHWILIFSFNFALWKSKQNVNKIIFLFVTIVFVSFHIYNSILKFINNLMKVLKWNKAFSEFLTIVSFYFKRGKPSFNLILYYEQNAVLFTLNM